jgi:ribosome maturation factor RimP
MVTQAKILELIDGLLTEKEFFVVSLDVSNSNKIRLLVDSMKGVLIEDCVKLSRAIEQGLDRETDDFELEVSSAGLDAPFRVKQQYQKNIGQEVEVIKKDGLKYKGILLNAGAETFCVETIRAVKMHGKKKKQLVKENIDFAYADVSKVKLIITF